MPGWFNISSAGIKRGAWPRAKRIWKALTRLPKTIISGLILVILGIAFLENYDSHHDIRDKLIGLFFSELGFAFLIAVIVFVILEEWAAREHGKTVIGYLYGVHPTGRFFKKIESYVLERPFYRGTTIVDYEFIEQDGENILIRYTVEYVVSNMCRINDDEEFVVMGDLNLKPLHMGATPWDNDLGLRSIEIDDEEQPLSILDIKPNATRRGQYYKAKKPLPLAYEEKAKIRLTHLLAKHDHDSDVWHGSIPATGVELRIRWDPKIALTFAIEAIHPDGAEMTEQLQSDALVIRLNQPFLVNHGIHFWWSPKAQSVPGASSPAAPDPASAALS